MNGRENILSKMEQKERDIKRDLVMMFTYGTWLKSESAKYLFSHPEFEEIAKDEASIVSEMIKYRLHGKEYNAELILRIMCCLSARNLRNIIRLTSSGKLRLLRSRLWIIQQRLMKKIKEVAAKNLKSPSGLT